MIGYDLLYSAVHPMKCLESDVIWYKENLGVERPKNNGKEKTRYKFSDKTACI